MRKITLLLAGILLSIACYGYQKNVTKSDLMMNKGKILIVFFSHSGENYGVGNIKVGNTKLIAEHIQKRTGGDLFEIEAEKSYNMPYNQLVNIAKEEAEKNEKPAFKGGIKNINQYDTIFIGGPIWWGTYPQVMFTFFDKYSLNGKTIIPFVTHEGSGLANTVNDLRRIYPAAKVLDGFAIFGHEVRTNMDKVDNRLEYITK